MCDFPLSFFRGHSLPFFFFLSSLGIILILLRIFVVVGWSGIGWGGRGKGRISYIYGVEEMVSLMRTSSFGSSCSKVSNYSHSYELPEDYSREYGSGSGMVPGGGAMLPIFLNDLRRTNSEQDLVEVTLELDDNSIVLCSVTPTSGGCGGIGDELAPPPVPAAPSNSFLARSSSAASRLCRKLSRFRSPASSSSRASSDVGDHCSAAIVLDRREEMKMKAKLMRNKSCAQRALGGLRFISITTKDSDDANELWKKVEARFDALAKDGLLAREDFGECIGNLENDKIFNIDFIFVFLKMKVCAWRNRN